MTTEEVKNVHREPHPFVSTPHLSHFYGCPVAFVGRIATVNEAENSLEMKTHNGTEVSVLKYRAEIGLQVGQVVEVRGIVNKDKTISFGESTIYD